MMRCSIIPPSATTSGACVTRELDTYSSGITKSAAGTAVAAEVFRPEPSESQRQRTPPVPKWHEIGGVRDGFVEENGLFVLGEQEVGGYREEQ